MANYRYYLKDIAKISEDIIALELADKSGQPVFAYKPGQYVMLSYFDDAGKINQRHAFSIASSPSENDHLALGIRLGGAFTRGLLNLKLGSPILVSGPYGNFIFKPKQHKDLVMLAGGIGITPFLSAVAYATDNKLANKLALLYSVRNLESASFINDINQLATNNPNLRTLLAVTDGQVLSDTPNVISGRVDAQMIQNFVGDISGKTFFICGPAPFMEAVKNNLLNLGVYKSQIFTEAFSMLDDKAFWPQVKNLSYATALSVAGVALIFYSIAKADNLAKSIKAVNQINNPTEINSSVSPSYQDSVPPTPSTGVSGLPANNLNSNPNLKPGSSSQSGPSVGASTSSSGSNSNWSTTPQPTTSTSIPVQSQAPVRSSNTKTTTTNNNITKPVVAPQPVTSSSTPITPNTINTGGYRESEEFDD